MLYSSSVFKDDLFKGKTVFATGGAGSIVGGQVKAMIALGANAVILGRKKNKLDAAVEEYKKINPSVKVLGIPCDVRDVKSLAEAAEQTIKETGSLDFVIAGAAGNFLSAMEHLSANAFKTVVDIDLLGSYNTYKATIDHVKKAKGAYIFVSATLHYQITPYQSHVAAAKAGVDALAKAVAVEYGPFGVRSNIIAPGGIAETEGLSRLLPKEFTEMAGTQVPIQRTGTIKDIADATVYLFSDAASYVSGEILVVDGAACVKAQTFVPYPDGVLEPFKLSDIGHDAGSKKDKSKL